MLSWIKIKQPNAYILVLAKYGHLHMKYVIHKFSTERNVHDSNSMEMLVETVDFKKVGWLVGI